MTLQQSMDRNLQTLVDTLNTAAREAQECCRRYQHEIGEYQKAADSLKNDNDQLHKKINDMSNREKEYEAAIAKGKKQQRLLNESLSRNKTDSSTITKLREEINCLHNELRDIRGRERDHKAKYEALITEERNSNMKLEQRLKEYHSKNTTAASTIKKLEEKLNSLKKNITVKEMEYKASIAEERDRICKLEQRLKESLSRENTLKEDIKKTTNNDIRDQPRPQAIAEIYGELYDNEWTDAYEILEKLNLGDKSIIRILLEVLKRVMEFCQSISEQQNNVTIENLFEMYISNIDESAESDEGFSLKIKPYVKECIKTCWLCVTHHPPIYIDFEWNVRGRAFNTDVFSYYTKSGRNIDFVIWPAMFHSQDGQVLKKGIAEGMDEKLAFKVEKRQLRHGRLVHDT